MRHILILFATAFVACSKPDEWTAFVYPDLEAIPGPEQAERYIAGRHASFESCQSAAIVQVRQNQQTSGKVGAYVCGLNCTRKPEFANILTCEEKRK